MPRLLQHAKLPIVQLLSAKACKYCLSEYAAIQEVGISEPVSLPNRIGADEEE